MSQPPYPPQGGGDGADGPPYPQPYPDPAYGPSWQQPYPGTAPPPWSGRYQGAPPYGQQHPYGQPPSGGPGHAPAPWDRTPATPGRRRKLVVGLVAGVAVVVAALAVALVVVLRSGDGGAGSGSGSIPGATSDPEGLGGDPRLDDYAVECHEGDMQACDDLYRYSPRDSAYELYGGSCAGRQPNAVARTVYCVDAFPPAS